jgi:hypothetical protein
VSLSLSAFPSVCLPLCLHNLFGCGEQQVANFSFACGQLLTRMRQGNCEERDETRQGFYLKGTILFKVSNLQAGRQAAGEAARHDTAKFKKNSNN